MIEPVNEPEKYVKRLSWKERTIKFLRANFMYIPFVLFFVGLASLMLYYEDSIRNKLNWSVDIGNEIAIDEYVMRQGKTNLAALREKIASERKQDVKRYGKFVSGKDVVGGTYGQLLYSDELPPEPEPVPIIADTTSVDTTQSVEAPEPKVIIRYRERKVEVPVPVDTVQIDTVEEAPPVFFASTTQRTSKGLSYTSAYIYGDQEVTSGSFVRLRLAEDLITKDGKVVEGTVFRGIARMSGNVITIEVDRIGQYNVSYAVYDRDYSHGLILDKSPNDDLNETLTRSGYRSGSRSLNDIPVDIARDVTRSIIQSKRQKAKIKKLSDGSPVYIATNQ